MKNTPDCKGLGLQSLGTFLILQFCHELLASLNANFSVQISIMSSAQHANGTLMFYEIFSCKSIAINGFGPSCESCLASDILFWSWLCLTNFATADANQHQIFGGKGTHGECCREFIPHDISCGKKDSCSHRSINFRGILCARPRLLRKCGQNPVVPKIGGHGLAFIRQGGCNLRNECKSAKVYREFS